MNVQRQRPLLWGLGVLGAAGLGVYVWRATDGAEVEAIPTSAPRRQQEAALVRDVEDPILPIDDSLERAQLDSQEPPNEPLAKDDSEEEEGPSDLEKLHARLNEFRSGYGALSKGEYEEAFVLAQTCLGKEIERAADELQEAGIYDERIAKYGDDLPPPPEAEEGKTSMRFISEPIDKETMKAKFVIVRHEDFDEIVSLEEEMKWLQEQIQSMGDDG